MSLYPDESAAVFTGMNGQEWWNFPDIHNILHYGVADMLLGLDPWLNTTTACSYPQPWAKDLKTNNDANMPPTPSREVPREKRDIRDFEGKFGNAIFGNLTVYLNSTDNTLRFQVGLIGHGIVFPLSSGNRLLLEGSASLSYPVVAYFEEARGVVNRLVIPIGDPEPPVVFVRGLKLTDAEEKPTEAAGCNDTPSIGSGAEAKDSEMWSYRLWLGVAVLVFSFI
ncbi:uncharacterized protein [Branchiostoma lanceolatum]|uniref:uncharacterized protein n=1 Tax=Branchiostoma lanceolatum TaxID=7740 RepID=UPI0034524E9F